jgi:hypothetical protein
MIRKMVSLAACLAIVWMAGCKVHVEKDAAGRDKNVRVETPFGGIHVTTDQTTAADVGLPVYPGAQLVTNDDKHKSADVRMGFGEWAMHVRVATYATTDPEQKVVEFYKKALGAYGDVLSCQNDAPVGTPAKTSGGLTCSDHGHPKVNIDAHGETYGYHSERGGFELKAGSERHQRIVGFQSSQPGQTRFALVELELPSDVGNAKKD